MIIPQNVGTFGYYWALQDGTANASASCPRNCTASCPWEHADAAFVQNSWKYPPTAQGDATTWDVSDLQLLARRGLRAIVSVSHVFTTGPAGGLHPDFGTRWADYAATLAVAGVLNGSVLAFYPSDEPDLRMPAESLNVLGGHPSPDTEVLPAGQ